MVAASELVVEGTPKPLAWAPLKNAAGEDAGMVEMRLGPQGWVLRVTGRGWPEGWHATHLHAVGSCQAPAFTSAGGHLNHPDSARPHGLLNPQGPDDGDLQNVHADEDGTADAELYLSELHLAGQPRLDPFAGDGLAFVVHANADDHVSQPIGGAGARIACGVFREVG